MLFDPTNRVDTRKYRANGIDWHLLWVLFYVLCISQAPFVYGRLAHTKTGGHADSMVYVVLPLLAQLLLMVAGAILLRRNMVEDASRTIQWFGGNKRSAILAGAGLSVLVVLLYASVRAIVQGSGLATSEGVLQHGLVESTTILGLTMIRAVIVTPIVEELFWRGYVQEALRKTFSASIGLLIQAILFTAVHLQGVLASSQLLCMGLVFGLWRYRKHTLVPLIVAHAVLNGFACANIWEATLELRRIRPNDAYLIALEALCTPPKHNTAAENAAHDYERAMSLVLGRPDGLDEHDLHSWPSDLPTHKMALLRDWVSSNDYAIAEFAKGTDKVYYCPEYTRMATRGVLSLLDRGGRDLVHVILARAQIQRIDGETRESAADILACYRFAEHFAGPKPLDYQLLGVTIKQRTLRVASRILMRAEVTEGHLDELQGGLGEVLQRESTPIDFSGERLLCHMLISETFTDDGTGEGHIPRAIIDSLVDTTPTTNDNGSPVQASASAWRGLRRGETARLADEVFAYLDSVADRTPFELSRSGMSVEDTLRALCGNNAFLRRLAPAYAKAYYVGYRQQAFARAFIVVMAVMQYQLEHGYLPSRLDQLVRDAYLGALPIDPFSGASFVYHALDTGFILYSFGPDFDDDGAIGGENRNGTLDGDDVFWPPVYR